MLECYMEVVEQECLDKNLFNDGLLDERIIDSNNILFSKLSHN